MDNVATPPPSRNTVGLMATTATETPSMDPYAFPADDSVPSPRSRTFSGKPLQLSVHPRTFLPSGNPLPHAGSHYQRGSEFLQEQFSTPLHSPVHGSQPSQPEQHFPHPSSRLENDPVCQQMDQMNVVKQAYYPPPSVLTGAAESSPNGVFTTDANVTQEKVKKKKKQKKSLGEEKEKNALELSKANCFSASSIDNKHPSISANHCPGIHKVHADTTTEARGVHIKSSASVFPSGGDSSYLPSTQGPGSHVVPSFPTTCSAATFTNSLQIVPQNRRLSTDSMEMPTSRPASRTSTVSSSSGSSEGKSKEAAESVPMSKILEIIERERMLGSSTPCKRRRTAKPQHIQEAEEEAKRFAAANAQGVPATDQASRPRNISASFPPEKVDGSSRTSSQVSSPNVSALAISPHSNSSSNDHSDKMQPQFPTPVNDSKHDEHLHSEKSIPYSASDVSYLDRNQKHGTLPHIADNLSAAFSHSTVSTQSVGIGLNPDDHKPSFTVRSPSSMANTAGSQLTDAAGSQLTASSSTEHRNKVLIAQEKDKDQNADLHQPSHSHRHHIFQKPTDTNRTYLNKVQENAQSGNLHHSYDPCLMDSPREHCASTIFPAPDHGQQSEIMCDGTTINQHSSSSFPSSTSVVENRNIDVSLQNSEQSLFYQSALSSSSSSSSSSSPPSQRRTGPDGNTLSNVGPLSSTPRTLVSDQNQDLKPSQTSNYHCNGATSYVYRTQSKTADMISGNDFLLSEQPFSSMPASAVKKPKKKNSPSKPNLSAYVDSAVSSDMSSLASVTMVSQKTAKKHSSMKPASSQPASFQSSAFSGNSLSGSVASAGTLPPFGAFAGMKMDATHSSIDHISDGSQLQCLSSAKRKAEIKPTIHQNALENQTVLTDGGYADSFFSDSKSQECIGNSMNMRCASSDLIEPYNKQQNIKQEVNLHPECDFPNTTIVDDVGSIPDRCVNLSSEDGKTIRPGIEQHFEFQVTNSEVIHHRTVADNPVINPRQGSTVHSLKDISVSQDKARLDFKPVLEISKDPSLTTPVIPGNSTSQARTLHDNCLVHEKAAFGSSTTSDKANGSRAKPVICGLTTSQTDAVKTPVTASQGTITEGESASVCVNNSNTLGSTQHLLSRTPAWGMSFVDADKRPLKTSFENGKWAQQEKPPSGKCTPQDKAPSMINGWNGKPSVESQTWKREKIVNRKSSNIAKDAGTMMANRFGRTTVEGVAKKMKADVGMVTNGTLPDFKRVLPGVDSGKHAPSTPDPKIEPSFPPMSPEEELDDRLRNNKVETPPRCNCLGPNYEFNESVEGPYYTQLGKAKDMASLRQMMEERTGLKGKAIRLEKVHFTGKEGRSQEGCPIAKWIIRRSGPEEKYLCVARKRPGHFCDSAYIVLVIVAWEGVASSQADNLYSYLVSSLTKCGYETDRRCGTNESKTCACQGVDLIRRGASFSFGCSWSMYFNRCKFARSNVVRKFKMKDANEEEKIEEHLQDLATKVAPLYKVVAPDAYRNQVHFEDTASMCRLGNEKGRPFSGVTACVDFCAHSHKDFHNMLNGSTVVVTLTKHRGFSKPDDEQLHVLPLYVMDNTDEHGSIDGQMQKVQAGALEILQKYSQQVRLRANPVKKPRRGGKKNIPAKVSAGVNTTPNNSATGGRSVATAPKPPGTPTMDSDSSYLHSQDSNQSLTDSSLSGNNSSAMQSPDKTLDGSPSLFDRENLSSSDNFTSQRFGPSEMYEKVWEYFYTHGIFPPQSHMDRWAAAQKQAMMDSSLNRSDTGANTHGSNLNSPNQPPSHQHSFQAADTQQNHSFPSSCQPLTPGHRPEAASPGGVDQEIIHLTHGRSSSDKSPQGHLPSRPHSVNSGESGHTGSRRPSSLDLLTECAAAMEPGQVGDISPSMPASPRPFSSTLVNSHMRPPSRSSVPPSSPGECNRYPDMYPNLPHPHSNPGVHSNHFGSPFMSPKPNCDGPSAPPSCNDNQTNCSTQSEPVMQSDGSFVTPTLGQGPDEPTFTMIDPTVVRYEWQDNKENFHDPGIGGVAIALSHGAVLFEVAKRELHATTALKKPNRYQPTRISLVFYQHKNLNFFHHGYYEYERQLAAKREDRIRKLMEEGQTAEEAQKAVKPSRKRKKKVEGTGEEEEKIDFAKTSAAQYKYMWDTTVRHGMSLTTDSIITRWIDPQPMVTGPYQRWV